MDILSPGLDVIRFLQSLGAWLLAPMQFFTLLGKEEFFLALMPLLYWCVSKPLGMDMGILLIVANGLNGWLKVLFKQPRPFWAEPPLGLDYEASFGLPSGHAMDAATLWGYLAYRLQKSWALLPILLILLISLSRLYLGVHFLTDVLGGWLFGLLVLGAYLWLKPRLLPWLRSRSFGAHVAMAALAAVVMMGLFVAALTAGAYTDSVVAVAVNEGWDASASSAGMLLGLWIGLAAEARYVRFDVAGTMGQRVARYLAGMIGVLVLWLGLKLILPTEPLALGLVLRFARYALMALWVIYLWPLLFVRLGLSGAPSRLATRSPA